MVVDVLDIQRRVAAAPGREHIDDAQLLLDDRLRAPEADTPLPEDAAHIRKAVHEHGEDAVAAQLGDGRVKAAHPLRIHGVALTRIHGGAQPVRDGAQLLHILRRAVLTEQEAQALLDSIRGMASRGIAVIFITHRLQEILSVCDKVVIMRDGYVVKDVAARETDVRDITHYMVGREVAAGGAAHDIRDHSDARTILSIRKLWVDMPGEIVRNVDLDVKEGEILGIGGLAGQGKLGIPNGVMGLYEAGGTVEFDGKPIALNSPRKCLDSQLAFVSEDRRGVGLLLDESLEWNVAFPAMQVQDKFLKRMGFFTWRDEKAIHTVTNRYIDELQIKCTGSSQKARELSGGNQQKVCLAKAFALEPRFLFVSEPTRGIDVGAKALVLEALKKFNRESGVTVVMISSELEELRQICDRIAIVSGGRVAGILPADHSSEEFGMLMVSQVK